MDAIVLRSLERLVVVAFGGLSIYLGYRLFLRMPDQENAQGRVTLPGGISIYMTRVGPGAFFALFGAVVLSLSFHHTISYTETQPAAVQAEQRTLQPTKNYSGFGAALAPREAQDSAPDCLQARADLDFIDHTLPSLLKSDLVANRRNQLDLVMGRLKRTGMNVCAEPRP